MILLLIFCALLLNAYLLLDFTTSMKTKRKLETFLIKESRLLILVLLIPCLLLLILILVYGYCDLLEDFRVELLSIIFEILVLLFFFEKYQDKRKRLDRIEELEDQIDDFRNWNSEEGKVRITGIIKRLKKLGITNMNLYKVDLSVDDFTNGRHRTLENVDFTDSNLLQTIFSGCTLTESVFNGDLWHTKFKKSFLLDATFNDSTIQGVNFSNSSLQGAKFQRVTFNGKTNFSLANITGIDFNGASFNNENFHRCITDSEFPENLKKWNLKGNKIFNDYDWAKTSLHSGLLFLKSEIPSGAHTVGEHIDLANY